ncbi:MAG: insulinase family protein [Holosporales bacterium]|nr:insulinase family protein [Holosporales bacterium]
MSTVSASSDEGSTKTSSEDTGEIKFSENGKKGKPSRKPAPVSEGSANSGKTKNSEKGKSVKSSRRSTTASAHRADTFHVDVHDVKTKLPHNIWYIPSDRDFVIISIAFKDAGMKNVNRTHPALGYFFSEIMKGCGNLDQYQFLEKIHDCGASIDFDVGIDDASIEFWAPSDSYKEALALVSGICLKPNLPRKYFELRRDAAVTEYKEALKDPKTHLLEAVNCAIFPQDHPYRESLKRKGEDIKKVKRDDVRNFLKMLGQNNATVVVLGPKEMEAEIVHEIEAMLLSFPQQGAETLGECGTINIPKEDVHVPFDIPQSMVWGVQYGFPITDPDFYAKSLAFDVVAGCGLDSIMFKEIREKHGLAYYCYGIVRRTRSYASILYLVGTRNETREKVKEETLKLLGNAAQKGVSASAFEAAKKAMVGSFIVGFNASWRFVRFFSCNRIAGRSIEESNQQVEKIEKLTLKDVNEACKKIFGEKVAFVSLGGQVAPATEGAKGKATEKDHV